MLVAAVLSRPRGQLPIRFKCGSTHFTVTGGVGGVRTREVSGLELGNWLGSVKVKTMSGLLVFVGVKLLGLFRVEARELQHLEADCLGFNPGNRASADVLTVGPAN